MTGRALSMQKQTNLGSPMDSSKVVAYLGGSLVGVWSGWGYGIAFFRALNLQISEPEIW